MAERMRRRRVTIADIARESGYSKTSVSFAFNSPRRISDEARKKILQVAESLGYYPDTLARNFSLQRHHSIGFLLPHAIPDAMQNPYIQQVIQGVGSVCQEEEYTLTVIPPFGKSLSKAIRSAAVDGMITMGMEAEHRGVDSIRMKDIPFITIDGTPSGGMHSVNIDDRQAAGDIMAYLLGLGHRRFALISVSGERDIPAISSSVIDRRMEGYREVLASAGLVCPSESVRLYHSPCSLSGGRTAGAQVLADHPRPTCIVTMSDITALGVMQTLREAGVPVPGAVSVAGFDNIPEASIMVPGLTTVDQPAWDKGVTAGQLLFAMIRGDGPRAGRACISHRLVIRESVAPPQQL